MISFIQVPDSATFAKIANQETFSPRKRHFYAQATDKLIRLYYNPAGMGIDESTNSTIFHEFPHTTLVERLVEMPDGLGLYMICIPLHYFHGVHNLSREIWSIKNIPKKDSVTQDDVVIKDVTGLGAPHDFMEYKVIGCIPKEIKAIYTWNVSIEGLHLIIGEDKYKEEKFFISQF